MRHDVIIVGGGPAGTSAAIHLAMSGAQVLLVEQKRFPRPKLCGEFISPECLVHFARLGVADRMISAGGATLARTIFYAPSGRHLTVPSEWFGAGAARGLSRAEMDNQLLRRAREVGVDVLDGAQAVGVQMDRGRVCGVRLKVEGRMYAYASLVTIDATGRARSLARRVEAATGEKSAPRKARFVAFKAHLDGARGAAQSCEIYSYRGGYGGLSEIEGGFSNLCFIVSAQDVRACDSDPERVMRTVVMSNRRAAYTLARARARTAWLSVALEGFGAREPAPVEGMIAAGDAAAFIDPFTGSGMLMALESGAAAAAAIGCRLPALREGLGFAALAADYRARYAEKFARRLRASALLRRVAFAPPVAVEAALLALSTSERMLRFLARATRQASRLAEPETV
jgi:flavin-dependent dehydrogenase